MLLQQYNQHAVDFVFSCRKVKSDFILCGCSCLLHMQATYRHGKIRGLVDVCLKTQREGMDKTGGTWLTDEYIKGLIYDTLAAGLFTRV